MNILANIGAIKTKAVKQLKKYGHPYIITKMIVDKTTGVASTPTHTAKIPIRPRGIETSHRITFDVSTKEGMEKFNRFCIFHFVAWRHDKELDG